MANTITESLGLTFSAVFVPQSQSRNAGDKHRSLNWVVTFTKGDRDTPLLRTDYMQGIGHVPKWPNGMNSNDRRAAEWEASEKGRYQPRRGSSFITKPLPAPEADDVLECLLSDATALDYGAFEVWAAEMGYDVDSRSAESAYNACIAAALRLRALIGDAGIEKAREMFQQRDNGSSDHAVQ